MQAAVHVGGEPLGPAGVGAQRHDEAQLGGVGVAQRAQVAQGGVGDHHDLGWGEGGEPFQRGGEAGQFAARAGVGPVVDGDPVGGGGLQGLDLAGDGAVGGPALLHQRRVGVGAGEPDRGQVQVQPRQVHPAGRRGRQRQLAAHPLGDRGQRLERPAEPVVVEQSRRDAEQFGHRRAGRPAGDVVQRGRSGEPVGHQRGDHLPVGEHGPPAHRRRGVDQFHQVQPLQVVGHQQQRPDVAAGAHRRRVEPRERGRQLLELARRLELVLAAQGAQHPVGHLAPLVPIGLHQPQVDVPLAVFDDRVPLDVHARAHPSVGWPYTTAPTARLHACDSACLPDKFDHDFGPTKILRARLAWITVRAQPKAEHLTSQGISTQERHTRRPQRIRTYAHSLRKTGLACGRTQNRFHLLPSVPQPGRR